jgi:hypothetical protein
MKLLAETLSEEMAGKNHSCTYAISRWKSGLTANNWQKSIVGSKKNFTDKTFE